MSKFKIEMKKIITNIIESSKFILSIIFILIYSFFVLGICNLIKYCIIPLAKKSYGVILLLLLTILLFTTVFFTSGWLNIVCLLLFIGWTILCFALMMIYSLGAINKINMDSEELECGTTETYNQIKQ